MGFETKPNLSSLKYEQFSGETLNLSGLTIVYGDIKYGGSAPHNPNSDNLASIGYVDDQIAAVTTGGSVTVNNGLTKTGLNVRLGGILTGNTTISGATKSFTIGASGSRLSTFNVTTTGQTIFTSYQSSSSPLTPAFEFIDDTGTNSTTRNIVSFSKKWTGGGMPDSSNAGSIGLLLPNTSLVDKSAIDIIWGFTDPDSGAETSSFIINGLYTGTTRNFLTITDRINFGRYSTSTGIGDIAIGEQANASNGSQVAIGYKAGNTSGTIVGRVNTISIGANSNQGTTSVGNYGIAVGSGSKSIGIDTIAIGRIATSNDTDNITIGSTTTASGVGSIAIGGNTKAVASGGVSIGKQAGNTTGSVGTQVISIGENANQGTNNIGDSSIAIGYGSKSQTINSIAIGKSANVSGNNSVVIGASATTTQANSIILGNNHSVGIGKSTPTARLHIISGSTTAGSAPIKLTSGGILDTPEDGALEYNTHLYFTIGGFRYQLDNQILSGVTANNGLTKSGTNIRLGGNLTGNTVIDLNDKRFNIINSGGTKTTNFGMDWEFDGIGISEYGSSNFLGSGIQVTTGSTTIQHFDLLQFVGNGLYVGKPVPTANGYPEHDINLFVNNNPDFVKSYITISKNSGITISDADYDLSNNVTLKFNRWNENIEISSDIPTFMGLAYDQDYSANYIGTSIPDANFVTGITSTLLATANNGLTKSGTNVRLGGTLTGDTLSIISPVNEGIFTGTTGIFISPPPIYGGSSILLSGSTYHNSFGSKIYSYVGLGLYGLPILSTTSGSTSSELVLTPGSITFGVDTEYFIELDKGNGFIKITDTVNNRGVEYASDYSANYTNRTLVDKQYVDDLFVAQSATTANNGLKIIGNNVVLGGPLTGDTLIGAGVHDLIITGNTGSTIQLSSRDNENISKVTVSNSGVELTTDVTGATKSYFSVNDLGINSYGISTSVQNYGARYRFIGNDTTLKLEGADSGNNTRTSFQISPKEAKFFDFRTGSTSVGLQYGSNYSANFTPRSLVDKAYVTGITSTLGNVTKVGTPVDNQVGVWTGNGTIEGTTGLTFTTNKLGLGVGTATARLHISGGTTTLAPIKLTTGTALTTPEDGAIEYHGSHLYFTIGSTRYQIDQQSAGSLTANNGLNIVGTNVRLGGNLTGSTTIGLGSNILTFTGTTGSIKYGSDLSANFTPRSLVDKGYVTGLTTTLTTTANNGLNKIGSNIRLGGTLTGATSITFTGFTANVVIENTAQKEKFSISADYGTLLESGDYTNYTGDTGSFYVNGNNIVSYSQDNSGNSVQLDVIPLPNAFKIYDGRATATGIQYDANYSANFTPRSLVDKGYVTGITSTLGNVTKVGTPVDNQVGVWTGNGTIEGTTGLTYVSTTNKLSVGTATSTSTATPATLDMGGTYADTITSSKAKWKLYNDGTPAFTYGIGITASQFNFFIASNASYKWYTNDVLKMTLSGNTGNLLVTGTVVGSNLTGTNTGDQTANNGVQTVGKNIRLGGSLTGNTTITTATGSRLNIAGWPMQYSTDLSANFAPRSLVDKGYVTGLTSTLGIQTVNNGLTKIGLNAVLGGSLTGNTTITTATGSRLNIAGWPMQYSTDLSANFAPRSLVDKGYVTGITSTLVLTANNGLTKSGTNVRLGGTLTGDTVINDGNFNLYVEHYNDTTASSDSKIIGRRSRGSLGSPSSVLANDSIVSFNGIGYKTNAWSDTIGGLHIYAKENWTNTATGTYITLRGVSTGTTTINEWVRFDQFGAKYASDYSSTFTPRSLVDKAYVTGITSTLGNVTKVGTPVDNQIGVWTGNGTIEGTTGFTFTTNKLGLGVGTASARLHISGGTTTLAPLKLTSGTALATPENGAIEYHSSHLYFTIGSTRYQLDQQSAGSVTANNGLNIVGTNVRLGGNLTGSTTIGLGSNILTFTGTTGSIKYGSNLSANFTSRSLVDKGYVTGNSETLNAKNYGATGDGTTDDASALNTWLNAGNNLYLPEGVYKIGSTISTTSARTGVTITAHPSARIVPTAGFSQTTSFFYFQNVTDLHINGVYIEGNGAIASPALTGSSKTMEGFFCEDCNKILIENCILTKQPKAGVQIYDSTDVKIINNYIPGAYNFAIWVWNGSNILISGNKVSGQGTAQHDGTPLGAVPGVMVTTADYVTIENNIIEDFKNTATKTEGCDHVIYSNNYVREFGKDGIKVQAYTPTVTGVTDAKIINNTVQYSRPWDTDGSGLIVVNDTKEFIISGNIIKGGLRGDTLGDEHGIFLYSFGAYRTSKGLISNNTIDTVCRQAILGEFCDDIIIENNYIRNYSTDLIDVSGIQFLGTPTKIKVLNNKVLQDSTPGGSDYGSGINIGNDALDIEINGNEITNPRELGILVNVGASDYIKISENSIKMSNGYPPVGLTGSGVAKLIKVNDNVFSGNVGTGGIWVNRSSTITDLSVIGNAMNTTSSAPFMQVSSLISKLTESGNNISGSATLPIYSTVPTLIQQGIYHFRGSGSPEGVVTATIGAIYTRTDENTAGTIYTKDSGTGNTGWNPINSVDLDFALMASFRNLYQY